ncbi:MAG: Smr/MutS family protein, partial [Candidatus Neoclostridium sp.]
FVEPFALVELNNGLQTALAEEQAEIERILVEFSRRVRDDLESIIVCKNKITMCDIVFSKAIFGEKTHGIKPFLTNDGITTLLDARHPLIDKNKVVPVSIGIGKDYSALLITGPNTGGKTVSMKTLGLMCLMAYSGIPVTCKEASISVYDEIFCDIGDEQSISNELSTFSSHIVNINNIIDNVTDKSLVLADELGGGTDPTEGAALAIGIIKYFETVGCKTIVSTHYDKLKEYALSSKNVMNACMLFDEKTLLPTYKLVIGMPGSSNALKIAEGLGMNAYVLREAEKNLDSDKIAYENIIRSAERIKNQAEKEMAEAKSIKALAESDRATLAAEKQRTDALYEKIKSNAAAEVKRIVSSRVAKAENIIAEMKILSEQANEQNLLAARIKRNQLIDLEYKLNEDESVNYVSLPAEKIKPGTKAIIKSLSQEAEILQPPNKKGEVRVKSGNITTFVKIDDLGEIPPKKDKDKPKKAPKPPVTPTAPSGLIPEIMVIGQTVAEAVETIEPYIVSAHSSPDKILRIVHGKGTMALAKGVQAYLKSMPLVKSFRFGRYGEGDNGVTVVTVK